mmetsp:Transcript_7143/g.15468  ORF Transcript_7143/g.15468 Transcript_7143/m.15468 type:complete len:96 (-) Transcript_7143:94-381(-)
MLPLESSSSNEILVAISAIGLYLALLCHRIQFLNPLPDLDGADLWRITLEGRSAVDDVRTCCALALVVMVYQRVRRSSESPRDFPLMASLAWHAL